MGFASYTHASCDDMVYVITQINNVLTYASVVRFIISRVSLADTVSLLLLPLLILSKMDLTNSGPHRNLNATDK